MPSNIDKAFIENLQNFTDALEGVVELMKEQAEKGDAINQMLSAMDGPKMSDIAEDIKTLVEKTDKIDSRTKQILEEVKASRKAKETGMFGKISDKSNKEKIVDGIGVIMLIAGGVLAIGMAFKIIGDVDVMSVISLGIAIYAISKAFAEIAQIKDLTPKKALIAGLVMVTIAGALVASSFILKYMQPIDIFTAFSLILVGGALGLAAFLLLKSVNKMSLKPKDVAAILLLPLILPLIAGAIVASSFLIKYMQPIDLQKGISFALLGGALGFAAFLLLKSIGKTDLSKNIKNILLLPLVLPIITGAIVLSSLILQLFQPLKDPVNFIKSAGAIGLGIIAFLPVFFVISKLKLTNPVQLLMGGLAILIVSSAIMLSSWILSVGNYKKYPSAKWSLGAGLAMILFLPSLVVFGVLAMTGIGLAALALGSVGALITAGVIVAVSHILNEGVYEKGPPLDWAASVGLLLPIFGASMVALALIPFAGKLLNKGGEMVLTVAQTIVDAADILRGGNYTGGPSKEWAEGIGLSLGAFANALDVAMGSGGGIFKKSDMKPEDFVTFIKNVSYGMIEAADILSQGNWNQNAPSEKWGKGVGLALKPFIDIFGMLATSPKARMLMKDLKKSNKKDEDSIFVDLIKDISWAMVSVNRIFGTTDWKNYPSEEWGQGVKKAFDVISVIGGADDKIIEGIDNFAEAIKKLSRSFNSLRTAGIDKFGRLTGSITILSAVDQNQLNNVIGVLDANKDRLADVTRKAGRGAIGAPQGLRNVQEKVQTAVAKAKGTDLTPGEKMLSEKFDEVLVKFDEVLDNMVKSGQGKDAGEKDGVKKG